jgi:DNA repair protein RadC
MIHSSNRELLSIVLGDEAALLATRSLAELFGLRAPRQTTTLGTAQELLPYAVPDRLMAARELLRRALAEELAESPVSLSSPTAVRDYLRLFLAGRSTRVSSRCGSMGRTG